MDMTDKQIAAIEAAAKHENCACSQWVRVEDALPKQDEVVFATGWAFNDPTKGRYYDRARFIGREFFNEDSGDDLHPPTHWMRPVDPEASPVVTTEGARDASAQQDSEPRCDVCGAKTTDPWLDHRGCQQLASAQQDEREVLPCPFCGGEPKLAEFDADVGGGDYQKVFGVWCENKKCNVKPHCNIRGEHGYRCPDDIDNNKARSKSIAAWNRRAAPVQQAHADAAVGTAIYQEQTPNGLWQEVPQGYFENRKKGVFKGGALQTVYAHPDPLLAEFVEALRDVMGWVPGRQFFHTDGAQKAIDRANTVLAKVQAAKEGKS